MALKIEQTWARIGLKSSLPQLKLQIREPQLQIKGTLPQIQIRRMDSRIRCDATQCREEIGLSTSQAFTKKTAAEAWQNSLEFIGRTAETGHMMADIAHNNIANIMGYLGSRAFPLHEFVYTRIPQSPVKVEVTPGELQFGWQPGELQMKTSMGQINPKPVLGEINVYLRQKAELNMQYIGSNIDRVL